MRKHFLWLPTWLHLEQPFMGGYGLGRLRWGWVEMTEQQWLISRLKRIRVLSVIAWLSAIATLTLVVSGCKC